MDKLTEQVERVMKRIRNLEAVSHPPINWDKEIEKLAKKVKKLEQLITSKIKE